MGGGLLRERGVRPWVVEWRHTNVLNIASHIYHLKSFILEINGKSRIVLRSSPWPCWASQGGAWRWGGGSWWTVGKASFLHTVICLRLLSSGVCQTKIAGVTFMLLAKNFDWFSKFFSRESISISLVKNFLIHKKCSQWRDMVWSHSSQGLGNCIEWMVKHQFTCSLHTTHLSRQFPSQGTEIGKTASLSSISFFNQN